MAGQHRSVYHGTGSEFLQYRNYVPGDDVKTIDWKLYARSDRFYTKVFREETNMHCAVVLDTSASMAYRGGEAPWIHPSNAVTRAVSGRAVPGKGSLFQGGRFLPPG